LKKLDNALTAIQFRALVAASRSEPKLRECSQLAELRQIEFHLAGDLLNRLHLRQHVNLDYGWGNLS